MMRGIREVCLYLALAVAGTTATAARNDEKILALGTLAREALDHVTVEMEWEGWLGSLGPARLVLLSIGVERVQ